MWPSGDPAFLCYTVKLLNQGSHNLSRIVTQRSVILLQNLPFTRLIKKFPSFHVASRFTSSNSTNLRSILILIDCITYENQGSRHHGIFLFSTKHAVGPNQISIQWVVWAFFLVFSGGGESCSKAWIWPLLYGDGVCFLWGTNWTVSTATSSQYLAVNCEPTV
jgi:hypothetical protein